jgi:hypothetical protein
MSDESLYPWRKKVKTLPRSFKDPIANIIQSGHIPKLVGTRETLRETLGMNRKPPTAYSHESAKEELQKLVKRTDLFDKATWSARTKPSKSGDD